MQKRISSRDALVVLEHPTEPLVADDRLAVGKRLIDLGPLPNQWPVADAVALMRPHTVVVSQILGNEIITMLLSEDQEEVEALELDRLNPALEEGVLVGRPRAWESLGNRHS